MLPGNDGPEAAAEQEKAPSNGASSGIRADRQAVLADCKEYWATLTHDARAECSRLAND
jgi:hypothetical protein